MNWYLPDPGIKLVALKSPAWGGKLFTTSATWDGPGMTQNYL